MAAQIPLTSCLHRICAFATSARLLAPRTSRAVPNLRPGSRHRTRLDSTAWLALLLVALVWMLALLRLFVDTTPRLPLMFNWTGSLPYHVVVLLPREGPLRRGDHVVYRFSGPAAVRYPGLRHQPFFKQVAGLPGDVVTVRGQSVLVNGVVMGNVRAADRHRRPLTSIAAQVIPPGHYFMRGSSDDSFDSRYAESGLVAEEQILNVVRPLF